MCTPFPIQTTLSDHPCQDSFLYFKDKADTCDPEILEKFIQIVRKPPMQRTMEELEFLVLFLKNFDFLKKIKVVQDQSQEEQRKFLISSSKKIKYEYFAEGKPIFQEGEPGEKIYLIIQGSATLYCPLPPDFDKLKLEGKDQPDAAAIRLESLNHLSTRTLEDLEEVPGILFQPKKDKRFIRTLTTLGRMNTEVIPELVSPIFPTQQDIENNESILDVLYDTIEEHSLIKAPPVGHAQDYKLLLKLDQQFPGKYIKDGNLMYRPCKTAYQGDVLGESALMNSKPRTMTVIASDDVHVISLTNQKYNSLLKKQTGTLYQNALFLKDLFFEESAAKFKKLASFFEECYYSFNSNIFSEGEILDGFYLIREGEIYLSVTIEEVQTNIVMEETKITKTKKRHFFAKLTRGEVFGEEDFFFKTKKKYAAVVASSKAVLLKMKKSVYDVLGTAYQNLLKSMLKASATKQKLHMKKITEIVDSVQEACQVNEQKLKLHCIQQKQTHHQRHSPQTASDDFKSSAKIEPFQRGYIAKVANSHVKTTKQPHAYTIAINEANKKEDNFELPFNLLPSSCKTRKKEADCGNQHDFTIKKVSLENNPTYKAYLNQLQDTVRCISARNTSLQFSANTENPTFRTSALTLAASTTNLNSGMNEKIISLSPSKKNSSEKGSTKKNKLMSVSSAHFLTPGYIGSSSIVTESSSYKGTQSLTIGHEFPQNEINVKSNLTKHPRCQLLDKIQKISKRKKKPENLIHFFSPSYNQTPLNIPLEHDIPSNVNSIPNSPRQVSSKKQSNLELINSLTAPKIDPIQLDSTRMIRSKHNMFRLRLDKKKVSPEKYGSPKALKSKVNC